MAKWIDEQDKHTTVIRKDGKAIAYSYYENESELVDLIAGLAAQYDAPAEARVDGMQNGDWYGSQTVEQMIEMRRTGWEGGRKYLAGIEAALPEYIDGEYGTDWRPEVTGEVLDVGLYCAGEPECWFEEYENEEKRRGRVVRILVSNAANGGTDAGVYAKFAARIVKMVDAVELVGYRVEVLSAALSRSLVPSENRYYTQVVKVKDADQPVDIDRLGFWLMNAGVHRRIGFIWRAMSEVGFQLEGMRERLESGDRDSSSPFAYHAGMGRQDGTIYTAAQILGAELGADLSLDQSQFLADLERGNDGVVDEKFATVVRELLTTGAVA